MPAFWCRSSSSLPNQANHVERFRIGRTCFTCQGYARTAYQAQNGDKGDLHRHSELELGFHGRSSQACGHGLVWAGGHGDGGGWRHTWHWAHHPVQCAFHKRYNGQDMRHLPRRQPHLQGEQPNLTQFCGCIPSRKCGHSTACFTHGCQACRLYASAGHLHLHHAHVSNIGLSQNFGKSTKSTMLQHNDYLHPYNRKSNADAGSTRCCRKGVDLLR